MKPVCIMLILLPVVLARLGGSDQLYPFCSCTQELASFPGSAQLFIALLYWKRQKVGGAWERGYSGVRHQSNIIIVLATAVIHFTDSSHCALCSNHNVLFMLYNIQAGNTAYDLGSFEGHTDVCQELLSS